jgi:tRNA (guanosine-2'-O-)-methyltransferase
MNSIKQNAKQLRDQDEQQGVRISTKIERNSVYIIAENVYDTYNIGGLFRLADAVAASGLILVGDCETPPNSRIMKASIGTYKIVPWEYHETADSAIAALRQKHPEITITAVEQSDQSIPYQKASYTLPTALLLGNETFGVLPETLAQVDQTVEIPMWGINRSLNVIVSAAIVTYHLMGEQGS